MQKNIKSIENNFLHESLQKRIYKIHNFYQHKKINFVVLMKIKRIKKAI